MTAPSAAHPAPIFINYRRTDAGWPADLLASELRARFGAEQVFLDARGLEAGDDYAAVLDAAVRGATVVIVLIGRDWLAVHDRYHRRRIDAPNDWVRREIRAALADETRRVIPVLLDDAELPDDPTALPDDIAALTARQRVRLRQAQIDDDLEALSRVLERVGVRRRTEPAGAPLGAPLGALTFSDRDVSEVVARLAALHARHGDEPLPLDELLPELDELFNRKTFRFEALRGCPEQRWADRLDSAYQTLEVLRRYTRTVRERAPERYGTYRDLVAAVDKYAMQMGALLFEPAVDYNAISAHIGQPTFKAHLPPQVPFPEGEGRNPVIPDAINDAIEPHRLRAVALMDQLLAGRP